MKLFPLLTTRKLPPRYNLIPFLTVHDPEADVKSRVSDVLCSAVLMCDGAPCRLSPILHTQHEAYQHVSSEDSFISSAINGPVPPVAARVELFEIIFIRLLQLLAHHPDFSTAHENLQEMAK